MRFLCRRGRENLRFIKKETFALAKDSVGREYVFKAKDELDKHHRKDSDPSDSENEGGIHV